MAVIKLFFSVVNVTDYLIVTASKNSTPLVEEAREVFTPPFSAIENAIIPAVGEIDAAVYRVSYYSSSDGTTTDLLLAQFTYDAKNKKPLNEVRFYQAGGPRDIDPAPNQNEIVDPYLDGKNITLVNKEGYGPLAPPETTFKQYERDAGGVVRLLNGQLFNDGEIMSITISYTIDYEDSASQSGGFYNGTMLIDVYTSLTDDHRGKRLKCEANLNTLEIILEDISTVPESTFYYFTNNGGTNRQTRILPFGSEKIKFEAQDYDEITIGKGEFARIEKYQSYWEVTVYHANLSRVGERIMKTLRVQPNTFEENGALYNGTQYPRIWYWMNTFLNVNSYIIDDLVVNGGYVRPVGSEGKFIKHSSLKEFRVPDTRGFYMRGTTNGINPGSMEAGSVGEHYHHTFLDNGTTSNNNELSENNYPDRRQGLETDVNNPNYEYSITGDTGAVPTLGKTSNGRRASDNELLTTENLVKNIAEPWLRCI